MVVLSKYSLLPRVPTKIAVAGGAGAGKSSLARRLSEILDVPYVEMDSLYHGPNWTIRETWVADVDRFTSGPAWTIEWQGGPARPLLNARADLLVWLDYPRWFAMSRVIRRTLRRRFQKTRLWADNTEGPLRDFFTDPDHIVRYAWRYFPRMRQHVLQMALKNEQPELMIVRIRNKRELKAWLTGPLSAASHGRTTPVGGSDLI